MAQQAQIVSTLQQLAAALTDRVPDYPTTKLVRDAAATLAYSDGATFTAAFQEFLSQAPVVKFDDGLSFTPEEHALWKQVKAYRQLAAVSA